MLVQYLYTKEDIFWHDDLHYIPGDGIMDIDGFINRLKKCNYQGNISFELKINHIFDTDIYKKYRNMGMKEYYKCVYNVAKYIQNNL